MPNDNTSAACGCAVELPKSRIGSISMRNLANLMPKSKSSSRTEGRPAVKKPSELAAEQARAGSSSVAESSTVRRRRRDKRTSSARRARSAERAESHYTYIDSGSSVVGPSSVRGNSTAEALYCSIDDGGAEDVRRSDAANGSPPSQQRNNATQNGRPLYAIPSMASPPPTYDVAMTKSWQTGLPPSYEEYLVHKHALLTRSHTPPPPWSDAVNPATAYNANSLAEFEQISRELLAKHPELREYLTQMTLHGDAEQAAQAAHQYHQLLIQQQALRKQAARNQRSRPMPPRSQSESRAQQRISMHEDGAFCMETTAIQSAFENGGALCSLM